MYGRSISLSVLLSLVAVGFLVGDAFAQKATYDPFTLMKSLKKEKKKSGARGAGGPKRIREGGFKVFKKKNIGRSGASNIKLSDVIKSNFGAAQKKAGSRGKKSLKSRGLYIKPAIEEHGIETKDAIILSRRTTYVVSNPKKHGARGHRAKKGARGGRANKRVKKSEVDLSSIPAKQRKFYKDKILPALKSGQFPKGHPYRKAYDKGGIAGFLNAFVDGKGDYSESDEVIIPKERPVLKDGRVRFPGRFMGPAGGAQGARGKGARFETTKKIAWLTNINKPRNKDKVSKPKKKYSYQETGGSLSYDHKFLTGWTWEEHWGKKYHKDYWLLEYKFWAFAGYTIGFRVPVKFKGKMSPAFIKTYSNHKGGDKKGEFKVDLSADVFDGDTKYFSSVGWTDKEPKARGKELPFLLFFDAGAFVEVFGIDILDVCVKKKKGKCVRLEINYSQDLMPVYGKNQELKMKGPGQNKFKTAAFYIPSKITRTYWELGTEDLWAKAEGLIGAEFGGDGEVSAKIRPVIDGKAGKARSVTLTRGEKKTVGPFKVPKRKSFGTTKFGYRISDPEYRWKIKIRPAVKAVVSGECDYWWCGYAGPSSFELGPWYPIGWITLGEVKLDRHKGTTKSYTVEDGRKEFVKEKVEAQSSMYVCLKHPKGRFINVSFADPALAFVKQKHCALDSTFKMTTADKDGPGDAPLKNGRKVVLQSASGFYLSIDDAGKLTANRRDFGPSTLFKLEIQGKPSSRLPQDGDEVILKLSGKRGLVGKNGGRLRGKAGKKDSTADKTFKLVVTDKPSYVALCPEGQRKGPFCNVKTFKSLSKIGDLCYRTAEECPCYVEKEKTSDTMNVWCVEKARLTQKIGGKTYENDIKMSKRKGVCGKSQPRKKRSSDMSIKVGGKRTKYSLNTTECKVGSFQTKRSSLSCQAVSSDFLPPNVRKLAKNKFLRADVSPLQFLNFKQNHYDPKTTKGCPYWVSSKSKKIVSYARPVMPKLAKTAPSREWVKKSVAKGVTAQKAFRLKHKKTGLYLKMEKNGSLSLVEKFEESWKSLMWEQESAGGKYVRIRSVWKPKQYLHTETGDLKVGPIKQQWHSAQWKRLKNQTQIYNRWKKGYLTIDF